MDACNSFCCHVSTENTDSSGALTIQLEQQTQTTQVTRMSQDFKTREQTREYHLTAKDMDLHSQTMPLKGKLRLGWCKRYRVQILLTNELSRGSNLAHNE